MDEREWAQRLLMQQLEFLEIIEHIPDVVVIVRGEGEVLFANRQAVRTFGVTSNDGMVGRSLFEFTSPEEGERLRGLLGRLTPGGTVGKELELALRRDDGEQAVVELAIARQLAFDEGQAVMVVARDITERKQLEQKLQLTERLASLGTLAAGVAHEINNPLAFVSANVEFVLHGIGVLKRAGGAAELDEMRTALEEAHEGTLRIRTIVKDLKTFASSEQEPNRPVDLREVAEWALKVSGARLHSRCSVRRQLAEVPPVLASEARLGQVLVNLIVNASDALQNSPQRDFVRVATYPDARGWAVVEVEDSGCGIPPERLRRIFDPFFTTKAPGRGTGLGLSISHGIITALGGEIRVESTPGVGTVFRVMLPPAELDALAAPSPSLPVEAAGAGFTRSLRILVVDDEPLIAASIARLLQDKHQVVTVTEPGDALQLIERGERFDALLLDLMMPGLTGMELYARTQALWPEASRRTAFMTGGLFTESARDFVAHVPNPKLMKPFGPGDLTRVLSSLAAGPS
jgi:PAS domain S-box-containing protein